MLAFGNPASLAISFKREPKKPCRAKTRSAALSIKALFLIWILLCFIFLEHCKSQSNPNTKMKLGGYGIMSINRVFILWAS